MKCPTCGAELPRNSILCKKCAKKEEVCDKKETAVKSKSSPTNKDAFSFLSALQALAKETLEHNTQEEETTTEITAEITEEFITQNEEATAEITTEISEEIIKETEQKTAKRKPAKKSKKSLASRVRLSSLPPDLEVGSLGQTETVKNFEPPSCTISYILCPPFQPLKLEKEKPFSIGREDSNMLILPSREVSRFHAIIQRQDDEYILKDLESANGTFVNDDYIDQHILQDGDKIHLGTNVLIYREIVSGVSSSLNIPKSSLKETLRISVGSAAEQFEEKAKESSFNGSIESIGLFPILQMLGMDGKTGCIKIFSDNETVSIFFLDGMVVHANFLDCTGREAFFEIMFLQQGKFEFDASKAAPEITMTDEIEMLLLECARRIDEASKSQYI